MAIALSFYFSIHTLFIFGQDDKSDADTFTGKGIHGPTPFVGTTLTKVDLITIVGGD
jgi:hypothetical protein